MAIRKISESTNAAVSVADIKTHLRIQTTLEDSLIASFESAARLEAEHKCKRQFVPQAWELVLDAFPDGGIRVPRPPLSTITTNVTITYINTSGAESTLASTAYSVDAVSEPGWIFPAYDSDWPDTLDTPNAVTIRYATTAITLPDPVKVWIMMRVGEMYKTREPIIEGRQFGDVPRNFFDALLDPYFVGFYFDE